MLRSVRFGHRIILLGLVFASLAYLTNPSHAVAPTDKLETNKSDKREVLKVEWNKLAEAKELEKNTSLDTIDHESVLKVVRDANAPQLIPLVTLKEPKLTEKAYVLRGKVRVEGVTGDGFLEMWNHFPEPKPGAFFTRTLGESGPMGKLRGTAPWREFSLPFMIVDKETPAPTKLQVNVFLPDKGTIWLSELILEEMPLVKLQSELQGSVALPIWFWSVVAASTLIPALILLAAIFIAFKKFRSRELGSELRRMKALDLS